MRMVSVQKAMTLPASGMADLSAPVLASAQRRDPNHVFIPGCHYSWRMLFLSAFARLIPPEPEANDLLAETHATLGHVGLTVIAIVFVLVTFWKS